MSTLKTHNLQSPDASSVNIALTQNSGMVVAGVSTLGIGAAGGVDLHHQNVSRLSTQSYGVAINGNITIAEEVVHGGDSDTRIKFPAADTISLETAGSERARINSGGKILIGHTSARGVGGSQFRQLQIEGTAGESAISIVRNSNNTSGAGINLGKSRSSSVGGSTIVQDDDKLGAISFSGADGVDLQAIAAQITGEVDGTPGENDMPGRIVFKTTADGASSSTERLRITSGGNLRLGLDSVAEQTDSAHYIMTLTGKSGQTGAGAIAFKDPSANTDAFIFADGGNLFITADYSNATADSSIRFRVDGSSEKMRISSEGYVTKPNLPYFNCIATPTAGSPNIHSFGTVVTNNGSHYNNSNGRFTAPVAGFYHFSFGIWCNASGSNSKHLQLMRYINASGTTQAIAGVNHATQYQSLNGSGGTHLEVGDYVYLHQTGITIQGSTPRNFFSGHLVG